MINAWLLYDSAGRVVKIIWGSEADADANRDPGLAYIQAETEAQTIDPHYVQAGEIHPLGAAPGKGYRFDYSTRSWVTDIETQRALAWERIKAARDAAEFGTLVYNGNAYDIDETSQRRIQGAVLLAQINPAMSEDWTLADNSEIALSASDIVNLGAALGSHVSAVHSLARVLRQQINAADSVGELDSIEWVTP